MNRALWKKSFMESRWLLLGGVAIMLAFHWLRVWITSQLPQSQLKMILDLVPSFVKKLSPVPMEQIATTAGRIALSYDDPLVLLVITVWGIGRGSDAVSGEISRGTMEMLLAQPVRRATILWTQAMMTILGGAILCTSAWLGTWLGLATIELEDTVAATVFIPAALNVFSLTFFLAAISTLASSWDNYRWRTIGIVGAFYVIEMIAKVIARAVKNWQWLEHFTIFTAFEPQALVLDTQHAWTLHYTAPNGATMLGGLGYDAILVGLGLACYAGATLIFCRRDIPAPL